MADEEARRRMAIALTVRVFKNDDPTLPIRQFVDTRKERAFMTHLLNGPAAEWLMDNSDFRWLTVKPSDFEDAESMKTARDFAELCFEHIMEGA